MPGGHVEPGEPLEVGIAREVEEECGIKLKRIDNEYYFAHEKVEIKPFYSFESNMSWAISAEKAPTNAHLIVYFSIKLPINKQKIRLKLQETEVSLAAWVS